MTTRRGELARKLIHLAVSLVAAVTVWRLAHPLGATVLAAATLIALVTELARRASSGIRDRFQTLLGPMLRDAESYRITGATTLAVGFTIAAAFWPGTAAVFGVLVAGIADPAAALAGRRWGRRRYPGGKSVEGSLAFLMVTLGLAVTVAGAAPLAAIALAVVLTLVEAVSLPVDDNVYVAPTAALLAALII